MLFCRFGENDRPGKYLDVWFCDSVKMMFLDSLDMYLITLNIYLVITLLIHQTIIEVTATGISNRNSFV